MSPVFLCCNAASHQRLTNSADMSMVYCLVLVHFFSESSWSDTNPRYIFFYSTVVVLKQSSNLEHISYRFYVMSIVGTMWSNGSPASILHIVWGAIVRLIFCRVDPDKNQLFKSIWALQLVSVQCNEIKHPNSPKWLFHFENFLTNHYIPLW